MTNHIQQRSDEARAKILETLKNAQAEPVSAPAVDTYYERFTPKWNSDIEQIQHFADTMRSVNTHLIWVRNTDWQIELSNIMAQYNINSIVLSADTTHGKVAQTHLNKAQPTCVIYPFDQDLSEWQDTMFNKIDAGFTDVRCGIAQTGTLVLWPDAAQPRTMSLIPPVHIALFDLNTLHPDFYTAMSALNMAEQMPTNVVLVSGPSKTADIQLTLAYGAHGPRTLVVLAIVPPHIELEALK